MATTQTKNSEDAVSATAGLSAAEAQLVIAIFTASNKGDWINNVDWQKVTDAIGATNIKATKERFRVMVSKHNFFTGEAPADAIGTPKATSSKAVKAKAPGSRKKKPYVTINDAEATPTKKVKIASDIDITGMDGNGYADEVAEGGEGLRNHFTA